MTKEEALKRLEVMNLSDDFMFGKVMQDPEICRDVLETITGQKIGKIISVSSQETLKILLDGKGVRLDAYVKDLSDNRYDAEMQKKKAYVQKRSRYYQSMIDVDILPPGSDVDYTALKKSFVVFICQFDPFGKGLHLYNFENICNQDHSIRLEDEAYKIFVNLKGTELDVTPDTLELLKYIENSSDETMKEITNPLVKKIHERISHIRSDEAMGGEIMTLMIRDAENRAEGREEGRKEGRKEGIMREREKTAKVLITTLKELGLKDEVISDKLRNDLNFSEEEIKRYLNSF